MRQTALVRVDVKRSTAVDCVWNVKAHAQKEDFVFRRYGLVHLNRQGRQFRRLLAAEVCASVVVMLGTPCSEVVWRVLATHSIRQFPLHFPSLRHRVPSHFNWTLRVPEFSDWMSTRHEECQPPSAADCSILKLPQPTVNMTLTYLPSAEFLRHPLRPLGRGSANKQRRIFNTGTINAILTFKNTKNSVEVYRNMKHLPVQKRHLRARSCLLIKKRPYTCQ